MPSKKETSPKIGFRCVMGFNNSILKTRMEIFGVKLELRFKIEIEMRLGHLSLEIGHWQLVIGHWPLTIWSLVTEQTGVSGDLDSLEIWTVWNV